MSGHRKPKLGLALAGGGPKGAIYEIGVLTALDEALEGVDLTDLHVYVGVSAGAFVGSCLANGIRPREMRRAMVSFGGGGGPTPFRPETFFTPAHPEVVRRLTSIPGHLTKAVLEVLRNPRDMTLLESLTRTGRALPVGLFDGEPIRAYLERLFSHKGRTDDFRRLGKHLVVVAADLDSGQAVRFGEPGLGHVPISRAVQASAALPGLYPPVEINGRFYVDGVLLKTLHASVALEAGADLLICVNPIVPIDTARAVEAGVMERGRLIDRGLPAVLSQTFRTLIRSRLAAGMATYEGRFATDIVMFEPQRDDYQMFFTNIFSFKERRAVFEHAYHRTRKSLLDRRAELEPIFERHGVTVRWDVLEDPDRTPWLDGEAPPPAQARRRPRIEQQPVSEAGGDEEPRRHEVAQRLGSALDRLERVLDERAGRPAMPESSAAVVDLAAHRKRRVG